MGQFFKFLTASCLGVLLAMFILIGIGSAVAVKLASQAEQPKTINPNSVLKLSFNEAIPDKTNNLQMDPFELNNEKILGLTEIVKTLEKAKEDDRIKGIFIETDGISTGLASATILQDALEDFKASGKFIQAYSKFYSQGAYYLASTADKIYLNPLGMVDFRGLGAQLPFFKGALDKAGIKMQVYYAGKFKSATEPYRLKRMSPENRLQIRAYLDDLYTVFLEGISENRNIPIAELRNIADQYLGSEPQKALDAKLIDAIGYRDEVIADMKSQIGLDEDEKLKFISLSDYNKSNPPKADFAKKNKIAVIYAEGTIIDGKGLPGSVGDNSYTKIIQRIKNDKKVKAVVLRVNSGGGSAMSSENIWRELGLLKETGRPIVVSMGDYAASGGYYIACNSDQIIAQPNTITGSIGVFSMIPSMSGLLTDKAGINFDTVRTGRYSIPINTVVDISPEEGKIIQKRTDDLYETFLKRVADARNMSRDEVHEIAQGRVWTGQKAKEIGLVDKIGTLENAIDIAAELAEIEEYRTVEFPKTKDPIMQLIESFLGEETTRTKADLLIKTEMGELYPYYKQIREIKNYKGVQARMQEFIPFQ